MAGRSIRAAAKATVVGGYRSAAAARRAVLPSSSQPPHASSAADGLRASSTIAINDWVIPDREAFGAVPTHEEAMEATLDLRDAFTIAKSDPKTHAKAAAPVSALLEVVHSETPLNHSETSKQNDTYENFLATSGAPVRVVQAFTMLNESPEARLSDCSSVASNVSEGEMEADDAGSSQNSNNFSINSGESFKDYVERMKALVSDMVVNLSNMIQDLVATSNEGRCKGKLKTMVLSSSNDFANDAPSTFVLLAIASIVVVLLKRV